MSDDLAYMAATDLIEGYRTKRISPVEATRVATDRIETLEERLNAFCYRADPRETLAAAEAAEARWAKGEPIGALDGVPMTIKDTILAKDWPTLRGSKTFDPDEPTPEDSPIAARVREQGAIILGKTTTPEFGWKAVTDSPLSGITRSPWNTDLTPGGSSGGSAASLAAGIGHLSLGTDAGGSTRIPAGFCNLVGFKATAGRIPSFPPSPAGSLAHHCPLTRTVADTALLMNIVTGPDIRDWLALPPDGVDYLDGLDDGIKGLRVAYSATLGYAKVQPEIAALVDQAARAFTALGAEVETVEAPFDDPTHSFMMHFFVGIGHALRGLPPDKKALLDPGLAAVVEKGAALPLVEYLQAVDARVALGGATKRLHDKYDLLLTPALAVPPFTAGRLTPEGMSEDNWTDWTPFTYPFNLSGQPAISVPCGFTEAGLPVGLQIVGAMHADALVLKAARAYEAAHLLTDRHPPL